MAKKTAAPKEDYAKDEPKTKVLRRGRYVGGHYPTFEHNGQECSVVQEQGVGVWVEFTPGGPKYLVHQRDVV